MSLPSQVTCTLWPVIPSDERTSGLEPPYLGAPLPRGVESVICASDTVGDDVDDLIHLVFLQAVACLGGEEDGVSPVGGDDIPGAGVRSEQQQALGPVLHGGALGCGVAPSVKQPVDVGRYRFRVGRGGAGGGIAERVGRGVGKHRDDVSATVEPAFPLRI